MTELLPIIEQLASASSYAERATWLLRCPLDILGRYETTIRNRLMHVGFAAGISYLDDIRIMKTGVRREDGQLSLGQTDILADAANVLIAAAAERDMPILPAGAPAADPTDL